jgi:hypothetical protein
MVNAFELSMTLKINLKKTECKDFVKKAYSEQPRIKSDGEIRATFKKSYE